ncbi:MAG TPA: glycosyltransferase family 4 protein [Candidatus Marinimicrobia bacterium]|nr:glycosyltransferase family 4 protein [Candidatus Neomarinimicrobiota bacterium]HOU16764.1 glycosyltransferase family 4 protein [Candidatus Neomarinimicrobiota bacterium]HOV22769.1 glycosyltransferase family 4 protein [Candidatus Neomarinimicrobiota bacterium]HQE94531.1 glycosyltransferase family 4 protein [Candidatus Neomarinimicrobiota bacterium]HQK11617.1 glycosyltransferase family 4 protein [Candidatus Neomarinimicrobiota bacterium]
MLVSNTSWYLYNYRRPLIIEMINRNINVIAVTPKDDYTDLLKKIGVNHIDIKINRKGMNPITDIILFLNLIKIYHCQNAICIQHYTIKPVIYGSLAAKVLHFKNVINVIPGLGYVFGNKSNHQKIIKILVKCLYRHTLGVSKVCMFQNPSDRDYFVKSKIIQISKTEVTYGSGVDLNYFDFNKCVEKEYGHCTFLLFGRLLRDKGVLEYVESARILKRKYPNAIFNILGFIDDGNPEAILFNEIEKWKKEKYINYLGNTDDVRPYIINSDVIVLPSYYNEGVPKSLIEALSIGRPLITTDRPGCREVINDGKNGIIIQPKNVEQLVNAIEYMIQNPDERIRMGIESRLYAEIKFDVNKVNEIFFKYMNI